jgi:hypothetical protein
VKLESGGETIAERKYTLLRDGHRPETAVVSLGKPLPLRDRTDFYCLDQSKRPDPEKVTANCGLHAFQALQLAMRTFGGELEVSRRDSSGRLVRDGDNNSDLGFSVPDFNKE